MVVARSLRVGLGALVLIGGCGARTEGPEAFEFSAQAVCLSGSIVRPYVPMPECPMVDGRCPTGCYEETAVVKSCAHDCARAIPFGCIRAGSVSADYVCAVREQTGEVYVWFADRGMPPGFRPCRDDEKDPKVDTLDEAPICTIAP